MALLLTRYFKDLIPAVNKRRVLVIEATSTDYAPTIRRVVLALFVLSLRMQISKKLSNMHELNVL